MITLIVILGAWFGLSFVLAIAVGRAIWIMGGRVNDIDRRTMYHQGQIDALDAADHWHESNVVALRGHITQLAQEVKGGERGHQWN